MKQIVVAIAIFGLSLESFAQEEDAYSDVSDDNVEIQDEYAQPLEDETRYDQPIEDEAGYDQPLEDETGYAETQESNTPSSSDPIGDTMEEELDGESIYDPRVGLSIDSESDEEANSELSKDELDISENEEGSDGIYRDYAESFEEVAPTKQLELAQANAKRSKTKKIWTGQKNIASKAKNTTGSKRLGKAKVIATTQREKNKKIQLALNRSGEKLKIDGFIGKESIAAIRRFQSKNALAPSGRIDQKTLHKLGVN